MRKASLRQQTRELQPCRPLSNMRVQPLPSRSFRLAPVALAISPADPAINVNGNSQFKVLATRSDDSVEDVTTQVNWSSSNSAVAKIAPSGLAKAQAQGSSTIGAELTTPLGKIQTATRLNVVSTTTPLAGAYSYRYDNTGNGQNRFETRLTPRNVNATTFGKLFAAPSMATSMRNHCTSAKSPLRVRALTTSCTLRPRTIPFLRSMPTMVPSCSVQIWVLPYPKINCPVPIWVRKSESPELP